MGEHIPGCARSIDWLGTVEEKADLEGTVASLRGVAASHEIFACVVGAETGVGLADALSEALGVRTNGTQLASRRDKAVQQRLVKGAGLRATREASGTKLSDVAQFLRTE